jgi:transcriptional regulator with XRE-family HTH domain
MHAMHGAATTHLPPNRLEELREAGGLKRYHLAAEVDVDQSTIYRWERGGTIPDEVKLRLADFFGVSPAYLMRWED